MERFQAGLRARPEELHLWGSAVVVRNGLGEQRVVHLFAVRRRDERHDAIDATTSDAKPVAVRRSIADHLLGDLHDLLVREARRTHH